jgi:phage head maturation protease
MIKFERYVRIEKFDPEQRMVFGYASTPDLDSQGDRVSVKAIENALPEYMRFANIREMHQRSAVGKTKSAEIDATGLYIGAKIVDEVAWSKVKEGVYSGFSIGGTVTEKVGDEIRGLELHEISLVDRPANRNATINLWKMEGGVMDKELKDALDSAALAQEKRDNDFFALITTIIEKVATVKVEPSKKEVEGSSARELELQGEIDKLTKRVNDEADARKKESKKQLLDAAARAGKFAVADRKQWETLYDKDVALCEIMLKTMQPVVPINQRVGSGGDGEETTEQRCEKIIQQIIKDESMADKPVTYDVAFAKAYGRNRALFERRDQEQIDIAKAYGVRVALPE